jgi:hypothetical protein
VLNKIKKLFMKKEETNEQVFEEQINAPKESDAAVDVVDEPIDQYIDDPNLELPEEIDDEEFELAKQKLDKAKVDVEVEDDVAEITPTDEEKAEMQNPTETDPDYLEFSSEAVGYESREQQWDTYRIISNYIEEGDSVLDFGCARGDFERFYQSELGLDLDYTGVDMNQQLVDAGKKVYDEEVELLCQDWFTLDKDLKQDWSINIGSSNLRYDADTVRNDMSYLKDTIKCMDSHCEKGSIILLASDQSGIDDGLINWNAGDVFNWAMKEFGNVAIDHTFSKDIFTLIIYKN